MSQDPRHAEIMQTAPPLNPTGGRLDVPLVVTPACPRDCSGRHEDDGWIVCGVCKTAKYRVTLHEYRHQNGHFFPLLEPMNGAPAYTGKAALVCCGASMSRRFKR